MLVVDGTNCFDCVFMNAYATDIVAGVGTGADGTVVVVIIVAVVVVVVVDCIGSLLV